MATDDTCRHGCHNGVMSVDFGSTYSGVEYRGPGDDNSVFQGIPRRETALLLKQPAPRNGALGFKFASEKEIVSAGANVLRFPKVIIMNKDSKRLGDQNMIDEVLRSWNGTKITREYTPAATFLAGFVADRVRHVESLLEAVPSRERSRSLRPAIVVTHPGGWTKVELETFKRAIEAAKISQLCCPNCPISFVEEHEAAICYALMRFGNVLEKLQKEKGAFLVADFGGITDDYGVFKFGRAGKNFGLPGETVMSGCKFMGGHCLTLSIEEKFLEYYRKNFGSDNQEGEIRQDIIKCRAKLNSKLTKYTGADIGYQTFVLEILGKDVYVPNYEVTQIIENMAEKKANIILDLIREAGAKRAKPSYVALCGGFSQSDIFREALISCIVDELGDDAPDILFDEDTSAVQMGALYYQVPFWFGIISVRYRDS